MIKKISIIGAGGVGSNLAFCLVQRLSFDELVIIDTQPGLARGIGMDLQDTRAALDFAAGIRTEEECRGMEDSDIVVITAGVARKDGMSRLDLLRVNSDIALSVSAEIREQAPGATVIVVTNPLDIITYLVARETGFARFKVLGMGSSLDTGRMMGILSERTGLGVSNFSGLVYGAHSKDMIVNSRKIKVCGEPLDRYLGASQIKEVVESVQMRGASIVASLKTKSACFAPALSVCRLIEHISAGNNTIVPLSVMLEGEYGLEDVCLGVPCLIGPDGVSSIVEMEMSPSELEELKASASIFDDLKKSPA